MTPDNIKDAIGIPDLTVAQSANGHYWMVSRTLTTYGQANSRSLRLPHNPTPFELEAAREAFEQWEAEETISAYNLTGELAN